jgi:YVTN family beta-propeller protein
MEMRKPLAVFELLLLVLVVFAAGCGGPTSSAGRLISPAHVLATISVPNPVGVAVDSATDRIYVSNWGNGKHPGTVTVIDGDTNLVTATVVVGTYPGPIAVNSTTNRIYVPDGVNSLVVIDGATNSTQSIAAFVGDSVCPIAVDPAVNRIYLICGGPTQLTVIDGATNNVSIVGVATAGYGYRHADLFTAVTSG